MGWRSRRPIVGDDLGDFGCTQCTAEDADSEQFHVGVSSRNLANLHRKAVLERSSRAIGRGRGDRVVRVDGERLPQPISDAS
jgi:hypothetical protein